jgi:hypothetical protein
MTIRAHATAHVADDMMGCSERWLIEQLRSGRFPGRKVGRQWRMTDKDVQDALDICANDARPVNGNAVAPVSGLTPTSRKKLLAL